MKIKTGRELGYKSPSDKYIWTACEDCGTERWVKLVCGKPKYTLCRRCRKGTKAPNWKGGIRHDKGWVYLYRPEHPSCTKMGYVLEHRLIMETVLGRYLESGELVHHINGIRTDNRLENLRLLGGQSEHRKLHIRKQPRDGKGQFLAGSLLGE